jgi:6-phosphofructokinase 1
MTALHGTRIDTVPLADAVTYLKTVPEDRMEEAESVF